MLTQLYTFTLEITADKLTPEELHEHLCTLIHETDNLLTPFVHDISLCPLVITLHDNEDNDSPTKDLYNEQIHASIEQLLETILKGDT